MYNFVFFIFMWPYRKLGPVCRVYRPAEYTNNRDKCARVYSNTHTDTVRVERNDEQSK